MAAAGLVTLVAAALVAAGPIYWSAASTAGLQRTFADSPGAARSIQVSLYGSPGHIAAIEGRVTDDLRSATATANGSVLRDMRGATSLTLPARPGVRNGDGGILGFLDGLPQHATLLAGAWPTEGGTPSGSIPVVVVDAVATELRLAVGDELQLATQVGPNAVVPVRLVGIFAVNSTADPYWQGEAQLTTGIVDGSSYRTFGPFLTTPSDLLVRTPIVSIHARWRSFPDLGRLTVDASPSLLGSMESLSARLLADIGEEPTIVTGLPQILGDAVRSLLVTRTNLLLLMAQLAILATYAVVLVASLLVDHRRMDTVLLLSRGAAPSRLALLAMAEGLMLAVPAILLGPWLAVSALTVLNVAGPLADIGLDISPQVTGEAYLASAAVGLVGVVLLALPAFLSARSLAAEHRGLSRQETRTFGQRMGLDVALLAVAVVALWQLRIYGAPLTRTVQGSLGIDPLLVAAPAISLLAGGILALRGLPLLAQAVEAVVSKRRDLVASLGSRQLARRPLRYTRSALLLMIAVSMGVFAVSYAATWSGSQRDQAAYQAGADVRVVPGQSVDGLPPWALPSAYAGLAGVEHLSPVERLKDRVSFAAGSGDLLGIDADTASEIALLRADPSAQPLADLMQKLRDGRPDPHVAPLPEGTSFLRVVPRLDITSIGLMVSDPATLESHLEPLSAAARAAIGVSVYVVVRDASGVLYRADAGPVPLTGAEAGIVLPLEPAAERAAPTVAAAGGRLAGPVEIVGLGMSLWLPEDSLMSEAVVGIAAVSASSAAEGAWTSVAFDASPWSVLTARGYDVMNTVPASQTSSAAVRVASDEGNPAFGKGPGTPSLRVGLLPTTLDSFQGPVPVIANPAFLAATGSSVGESVVVTVDGAFRRVSIVGEIAAFPTTDQTRPLIIFDEPTLGLLRLVGTGEVRNAGEWWLQVADGRSGALAATLLGHPFNSTQVLSVDDRARSLSTDPVAVGMIGALAMGFVATALFAMVGLTLSAAVSARERRTEFALLRALGLSGRQLSGWLWLENGSLVVVSLLAGTGLGVLTSWLVLPFVTVTQAATAPVPPVIVEMPWDRILLVDIATGLTLGAAVLAVGAALRRLGLGSVLRMGED